MSKKKEPTKKVMEVEETKDVVREKTEESPATEEIIDNENVVEAEVAQDSQDAEVSKDTEALEDAEAPSEEEDSQEQEAAETVPSLEEELDLARQEASKNLDNWQRAVAELANYKRRQEEQRKRQRDQIKSEVLQGVVSALDDMDLAFQNLPPELDGQVVGWVEGFRLVQRKLDRILDDQNVMSINTEGKFDPNFHEAVSYEENEEHEDGDIIAELRKGYQIGSRIIRPALVRVAK